MKIYKKKPTVSFIIFLAVLILPIIIYSSVRLYQFLTFDKEEYVIYTLEGRYNSKFVCEGKEETGSDNTTVYYLKASVRPDLTVTASYWEGWNKGPMSAVPFNLDWRKEVTDDFFAQIIQETKEKYIHEPIDLTAESADSVTDKLFCITEAVSEKKKEYIRSDHLTKINDYFSVSVAYKGESGEINMDSETKKNMIKKQIRSIMWDIDS